MATPTADANWRKTLDWLELRNGTIQIASATHNEADDLGPVLRGRLLQITPDGLIVEKPRQAGVGQLLTEGGRVQLIAMDQYNRWYLQARVVNANVEHRLNADTAVPAVQFSFPKDASNAQRRGCFRVVTDGLKIKDVVLTPKGDVCSVVPSAQGPVSRAGFSAKLLNIGGGGIGVEAPEKATDRVASFSTFTAEVKLPTSDKPMKLQAELVHLQTQYNGSHYLGLRFTFDREADRLRCEDEICKFTSDLQRRQIQRLKRAS